MTAAEKKRAAFVRLRKAAAEMEPDKTIGVVPDGDDPIHVRFLRATVESPLTPDDVRMKAALELAKIEGAVKEPDAAPAKTEKLGKKEQAQREAEATAKGRFAPPRAPRPRLVVGE